jgi:acetyl esterase/lipase
MHPTPTPKIVHNRWSRIVGSWTLCLLLALTAAAQTGSDSRLISLWPAEAPGETTPLPPEVDTTKPTDELVAGKRVIRIGNVSTPTLTVYAPPPDTANGAAVLVLPGGGYHILAWDLEGTEVCEWLNSLGITGVLVKYRVPRRTGVPHFAPPLQDAQRALGIVRHQAKELGLDPQRIGVLGFSAGGHVAAMLSHHHAERSYPRVDEADDTSCRPDFAVLIYPGFLTERDKADALAPEMKIKAQVTPPTFLAMSQDDPVRVENVIFYYLALKQAGIPGELHVYPEGGHGYGLRRTAANVTSWPDRVADWMRAGGWSGANAPAK